MQLSAFLATSILAGLVSAATLPVGVKDGVYRSGSNEHGEETHEWIGPPATGDVPAVGDFKLEASDNATSIVPRSAFDKRCHVPSGIDGSDGGTIACGCGITMNQLSTDRAVIALKAQLPLIAIDGEAIYSINNGVVAFVCGVDNPDQVGIYPDDVGLTLAGITTACGSYVPGTFQLG